MTMGTRSRLLGVEGWVTVAVQSCDLVASTPLRRYDSGERSPIFFQFLDCVRVLMEQFPWAFEFNAAYVLRRVEMLLPGAASVCPTLAG